MTSQTNASSGSRVSAITGGASGIGKATATLMASRGWSVALIDIDIAGAEAVAIELRAAGHRVIAIKADVGSEGQFREALNDGAAAMGGLDSIVHNAAVVEPGALAAQSADVWHRVMSVGAEAALHAARASHAFLTRSGVGSIVNVASIDAILGEPGVAAYCASKGAIVSLTRALASELATDGIRVNCVCPGITATPQTEEGLRRLPSRDEALSKMLESVPMRRMLDPGEIAEVIEFLASQRSSAMTGAVVVVDGGLSAAWR